MFRNLGRIVDDVRPRGEEATRSLDLTVKKDGKPFFIATCMVPGDGKSMTEIGAPNEWRR